MSLHRDLTRVLQNDPALLATAERQNGGVGIDGQGPAPEQRAQREPSTLPVFPKMAWRGVFADYRAAMERATEASDTFHFAALWARCAVALGRRVHFNYGMKLFPNVYLVCFGPTGDRKTTATRMGAGMGSPYKLVSGGGSGEGLADEFSSAERGQGILIHAEEFSQILRPGRWDGSTLKPFLTQCFDCPDRYQVKFRTKPIELEEPTASLLAGTTADWFWQDFQARDFQGGFGNRILFFTGERKPDIPLPETPSLEAVSRAVDALAAMEPCGARLEPKAQELWGKFYRAWGAEDAKRDPLLLAAVQRIPPYILKLAMLYAALERTLPEIQYEQIAAAILVGRYGEACAGELLSLQHAGTNPRKELERRILAYVGIQPSQMCTRREIYKALWRHYSDAEAFNRAFDSLVRAGELFTKAAGPGSILVSREPLE
jgi:hypothetical protein